MRNAITLPAPLAQVPWIMLIPLTMLVLFGAAVLHSAAGGSMSPYATSHLVRYCVFLVMAFVISYVPRELVMRGAYPAYAAVLLLLLGVEVLGAVSGGSQRWLDLGFIRLQPSELMKPTIVLVLASFFHSIPIGMISSWRALGPPLGLMALPMGLVMLQPDLGTGLAIGFGGMVVLFLAGIPLRWFIGGGVAAMIATRITVNVSIMQ